LLQSKAGTHSFGLIAAYLAIMLFFLGVAYTPWMASFTETVEHHNPAAVATGLAIWGWIIRVVVFASSLLLLLVINTVTPLVSFGSGVAAYAAQYPSVVWAGTPAGKTAVADYQKYATQFNWATANPTVVANAQKFGPELAIIQAHVADFTQAAAYTNPATIPPALLGKLVADAGGGATGVAELTKINANKAAINGVIANATQLQALAAIPSSVTQTVQASSAELTALGKVPPNVLSYMKAHGADVANAAAKSPGQWKTWWWVCVAGLVFFLLSVPLLRGRWSPKKAKQDEEEHEAMVQAELAKFQGAAAES